MKYALESLLLLVAGGYAFMMVAWMHAPVLDVLTVTAAMFLLPLLLVWLARRLAARLRALAADPATRPRARAIRLALGALVLLACAVLVRSNGLLDEGCGLTFLFDEEGARAALARRDAAERRDGYRTVCRGDLGRFDISFQSLERATRKLAFAPLELASTPFARFEALGARAEEMGGVRSRLYRGFRMPDGHALTLFEQDMSADGSSTWRRPADEPERIHGLPARLDVLEDPDGKAVSLLSWVEGRRDLQLWIDANVVREPLRAQLFALAASLPRSVPACPKEIPPRPMRFGPDGEPLPEPPTAMLAEEELARLDTRKRPCR